MVKRLGIAAAVLIGAGACTAVLDVPDVTVSHVKCEDGKCVCEPHHAHCVSSSADKCETDLRTASQHCGACGHDCLGGECQDGVCQPLVIASVAGARGLVAHAGEVYLAVCRDLDPDAGASVLAFLRLHFEGGAAEPAIHGPKCGELPLLKGDTLYWSGTRELGQGAIQSISMPPASDMPPVTPVVDGTIAVGLAATDVNVYWRELAFEPPSTWTDTGLWMKPLQGGTRELLVEETISTAASGDTVYWTSPEGSPAGPGVFQRSEATGVTAQITSIPGRNMASDEGHVYFWVKDGTDDVPAGIYAMPIPILDPSAPPEPALLVPGVESMGAIAAKGGVLMWIENVASEIKMLDLGAGAGAKPRLLVDRIGFGGVARLAADDKAVYFIGDSVVGRVAR